MNYVFIDSQNLIMGMRELGWKLDYGRFRIYLKEKYKAKEVFMFMGYLRQHEKLYKLLSKLGYRLIFKPITFSRDGRVKGNCDADLVLNVMIEYDKFYKAILITSDGDFYSLVNYLKGNDKLLAVLSSRKKFCSRILQSAAKEHMRYLDILKPKIEWREYS